MHGSYDIGQLPVNTILRINSGTCQYLVNFTPQLTIDNKAIFGAVIIDTNDAQLIAFLATRQVELHPTQVGISRVLWSGGGFLFHIGDDIFQVNSTDQIFNIIDGVEKRLI